MGPHRLVTVGSYSDYTQAILARIRLESESLESVIEDENIGSLGHSYGSAIGGVKLRVLETDREAALVILYGQKKASDAKRYRCPRCVSTKVVRGIHLSLFGVALFSIPQESSNCKLRFKSCEYSWRDSP